MLSKKQIEQLHYDARLEDSMSMHSIEKHAFQSLLLGMIAKLIPKKSGEAEKQLEALRRMERFLERLTYQNVIKNFQAKLITTQDKQIALLEQEKQELIEENTKLKKNIR